MTPMMKAAVLHKIGEGLKIESIARPKPGAGQVLIKVKACGVCHSDLHAVEGDWTPHPALPLIPGHEVTGHVEELGEGVAEFARGDRIGVPWMFWSCGTCEYCLQGMETICPRTEATGYSKPGGYAEYMVAPAAFCGHLASHVDMNALAPILCAGVTTYRGIKRTGARPGQWFAVIGIGGLGHIAVQYARAMGMRVAAVDVSSEKLKHAQRLGAEVLIDAREGDPGANLKEKTGGGAHGAVVTAVSARAFEQSVTMLRPAGTVCYIGLPGGDADQIRMSISSIVNSEISVRGSNVGTRQDLNEAIAFASQGLVKADIETQPLENINAIFARMKKGGITGRVVLEIG
ncbi:MAG: zinc-dependent alcohol dehydrogenase [Aestuariivirga sp.]